MYNIELLAKLSGLTKRTVRYYIEKGLLEPPVGSCRGSYYTDNHLDRLEEIKKWSHQGIPLTQVKSLLDGEVRSQCVVSSIDIICTTKWEKLKVKDGLELHFWESSIRPDDLKSIYEYIYKITSSDKEQQ